MKKLMTLVLIAVLLCGIAMAEQMGNPWTETTQEAMTEALGFGFAIPEDATDVVFSMSESLGMAQAQFVWNGVADCTVRMKSSDVTNEIEDISGMNYDWTLTEDVLVSGREGKFMAVDAEEGNVQVCNWLDVVPGFVYSVSVVQQDADGFDILGIAEQVFVPMQGEA